MQVFFRPIQGSGRFTETGVQVNTSTDLLQCVFTTGVFLTFVRYYDLTDMVYITRIEKFNAAHKLWVESWSEDENRRVFGKCSNSNWHGHNYYLHVTVKGKPDPMTGFIVDAKALSALIQENVTDFLDHSNLNLDVPFIPKGLMPTTENLVIVIWKQLVPAMPATCQLHCVRLYETDSIYAEYYGEDV